MKVIKQSEVFEATQNQHGDWVLKDHAGRDHFCTAKDFKNKFNPLNPVGPAAAAEEKNHIMLNIEVIPQEKQRYPTVGDWQFNDLGELFMKISEMQNPDYQFMVAIHEAIEAWLCRKAGITQEMVDAWDMGEGKDLEDPGSDPKCPYNSQHMFALKVERMLCGKLGLDWDEYENKLAEICPTE